MIEMLRRQIDVNSDIGEGFGHWTMGDDEGLLRSISSANVACGFHAGDPATMVRTCRAAAEKGLSVGAHVGYRDLFGFGRRHVDLTYDQLLPELWYQLGALDAIARSVGTRVSYIKPHGALYHALDTSKAQAAAVIEAAGTFDASLPVLGMSGSQWLADARRAGLTAVNEVFADRAYDANGALVSRQVPGSVLHDPQQIAERCLEFVQRNQVESFDGKIIALEVDSICVHGDTPGAANIAARVVEELIIHGISVLSFSG